MSSGTMRSTFPFTESQLEELEQQALVFKYIVSGVPVPHHLLFPIRRSSYFPTPTLSPKLFSRPSPHLSWNVYEMGVGRKIDPEPGRCRRTDGKKWRCSKEAYPDSKYCERHMHRGKNRSRKPVEFTSSRTSIRSTMSSSLSLTNNYNNLSSPCSHTSGSKPFHGLALSSHQDHNAARFFLESTGSYPSYMDETDQYRRSRYMDENAGDLLPMEPSGSIRGFSGSSMEDGSWGFTPLTTNTSSSYTPKERDLYAPERQDKPDRHCFILGTDVTHQMPFKSVTKEEEEPNNKQVHRFFDEWPQENREASSNNSSVSTTLFI